MTLIGIRDKITSTHVLLHFSTSFSIQVSFWDSANLNTLGIGCIIMFSQKLTEVMAMIHPAMIYQKKCFVNFVSFYHSKISSRFPFKPRLCVMEPWGMFVN